MSCPAGNQSYTEGLQTERAIPRTISLAFLQPERRAYAAVILSSTEHTGPKPPTGLVAIASKRTPPQVRFSAGSGPLAIGCIPVGSKCFARYKLHVPHKRDN